MGINFASIPRTGEIKPVAFPAVFRDDLFHCLLRDRVNNVILYASPKQALEEYPDFIIPESAPWVENGPAACRKLAVAVSDLDPGQFLHAIYESRASMDILNKHAGENRQASHIQASNQD